MRLQEEYELIKDIKTWERRGKRRWMIESKIEKEEKVSHVHSGTGQVGGACP
jgi:hypothetical protein